MRGTPRIRPDHCPSSGIIPAYAGNTSPRPSETRSTWDHPRICGEHTYESTASDIMKGSSPHMRGTLPDKVPDGFRPGIIPAYAGNTPICLFRACNQGDHPRICGEHSSAGAAKVTAKGSSPHMRGTLAGSYPRAALSGIIPAYAGNTQTFAEYARKGGDHPRICGEHYI